MNSNPLMHLQMNKLCFKNGFFKFLILISFLLSVTLLSAQDNKEPANSIKIPNTDFYDYRGTNVFVFSIFFYVLCLHIHSIDCCRIVF